MFPCADLNTSYVGETYRHISTWTPEHLETIKILTFTGTSVKSRNENQFVMRTVFQF